MPKKPIEKVKINEQIFRKILKIRKYHIQDIGLLPYDKQICSDRTFRRSLKSGEMRQKYLEGFSKLLDVDSRFLSGELFETHYKNFSINMYLSKINEYPYSRKNFDELRQKNIREYFSETFSLFDISYDQFDKMDFDEQYNLQYEILSSISTILSKYFTTDGYGNTDMLGLYRIIYDLENYRDNHYEYIYGDTILRKRFIEKTPTGYTISQIKSMNAEDILSLNRELQWKASSISDEESSFENRMKIKYSITGKEK